MVYTVTIQKQALKSLAEIPEPYYSKIKSAIYSLALNPRPYGVKKLKNRSGYRITVADYWIIYNIYDRILLVEVIAVGHWKDIYD